MGSSTKLHAVCIPAPAQGHITPMMNFAKLLHSRGYFITFVNTEYNHRRLVKAHGAAIMQGLPDFRFETVPDSLPPTDNIDVTQDVVSLGRAIMTNFLDPFLSLLKRIKYDHASATAPPITSVVGDFIMGFSFIAAKELDIPSVMLWTASSCGLMAYLHYRDLVERGLVPLKDVEDLSNGYLDKVIDWVPGLKNIRLKDFPTFIRTTDRDDFLLNFFIHQISHASMPSAIVINTFDELESPVLTALSTMLPPIYTIGPLPLICSQKLTPDSPITSIGSALWKEDTSCLQWLESKAPGSVLLVSFGSITMMTDQELIEFAWGLTNSKCNFIWVVRPDLVRNYNGSTTSASFLPQEFTKATRDRGLIVGWCPQEKVLGHVAVGGFLTHCGWNSVTESIACGVPMLCWPFFAEQHTNCWYACTVWENAMEMSGDVKRGEVERLIREFMGGEKGMEMRMKAKELKKSAVRATRPGGSSFENFEKLVEQVLVAKEYRK